MDVTYPENLNAAYEIFFYNPQERRHSVAVQDAAGHVRIAEQKQCRRRP